MMSRLESLGKAFEDAVLVVILGSMILLAATQIFMRNFLDMGFIWSDELLRLLVLWLAVAGAVAASRKDRHISIAILDQYLPEHIQRIANIVLDLFTCIVCSLICWHSAAFVRLSHEYGDLLLGNVPAWIPQIVMPIGFGLIAWRYLLFTIRGLMGRQRAEPIR